MLRKIKYVFIAIFFNYIGFAQNVFKLNDVAEKLHTISVKAKQITADKLGNLYVVSVTNQLYKYSSSGDLISTLNYNYSGNITSVDATNPLEIYVFYQELNTVIFLDNNLAYRGIINLSNAGINQAIAAARNYENGLWVFDAADLMLKKLDKNGTLKQTSGNIRQFIKGKFMPQLIFDDGLNVYAADSANTLMQFDVFANHKKKFNITGRIPCMFGLNKIAATDIASIYLYRIKPFELKVQVKLPLCKQAIITNKHVVLVTDEAIEVFLITHFLNAE